MITASLNNELAYNAEKPLLKVMLDTAATKEIRITMRQGQVMKEHKAPYPIVVHVVEGVITFAVGEAQTEMKQGDMIALEALVLHELSAREDSIIRLSLHKLAKH